VGEFVLQEVARPFFYLLLLLLKSIYYMIAGSLILAIETARFYRNELSALLLQFEVNLLAALDGLIS
jgi:hypothetical protein